MPYDHDHDYENEPSFRADEQTPQGLSQRDAGQARHAHDQGRRNRTARKARAQRSLPLRFGEKVSSAAA